MAERFDLDAIEADDALLDLLAAGGDSAWEAGEHDPALKLLADLRLAVEVEGELPVEAIDDPESFLARCAALNPVMDPFARKMAARGLALGVAAVAALSVSGVAAAVTGDPLSPYEKVIEKVVEGLRPQAAFPKEQLDGMGLPLVDKTKIVKVAKDYQQKQEQLQQDRNAAEGKAGTLSPAAPAAVKGMPMPPLLARVTPPKAELPAMLKGPVVLPPVEPTQPVAKPVDPTTPSTDPTPTPTPTPTDPPATTPTTPAPTDPPSATPSSTPADTGATPGTGNGATGANPPPADPPTTAPSTAPSGATADTAPAGAGAAPAGTSVAPAGTDTAGSAPAGSAAAAVPAGDIQTQPSADLSTADLSTADQSTADASAADELAAEDSAAELALGQIVPVLPTPTGEPVDPPSRLKEYFGEAKSSGRHSGDKVSLGWAKEAGKYASGKHSSGNYAEGKHAAVTRAHGSMAPMTLRQILAVLNGPTSGTPNQH
ncbi:MAG TPA: hypothetical protein VGD34_24070 [Kribbella sp.]|jgi:hypothetical protein